MFKSMTLALAALTLTITSAKAGDLMDDLATMDLASINDSASSSEEIDLDALDMDALEENAGSEADEASDAIEACFRRMGFRRGGWRGGFRGYGYGYRNCFRSNSYSTCYHRPLYCYRPIVRHCYSYCQPVIASYWGCH